MPGLSCLTILSKKGKPLIMKYYKNDVSDECLSIFNLKLIGYSEENSPPMFNENNLSFFYKKHRNIFILGVGKGQQDAIQQLCFIDLVIKMLTEFFGKLDSDIVKDNTIVIYELLNEVADNGWPQVTETKLLKSFLIYNENKINIKQTTQKLIKVIKLKAPWRYKKYRYAKNEVFLDVIEKINMLIDPKGEVLRSEVEGTLHMNCKLSGVPELKLGLNDKKSSELRKRRSRKKKPMVDIQDIKFHNCVQLDKFENEGVIMFIPPDGEFDLMNYRMNCALTSLFSLNIVYLKETDTKCSFEVNIETVYKNKISANLIKFLIPLPEDSQGLKMKCSSGKAEFIPNKNVVAWSLTKFKGCRAARIEVDLIRPSVKGSITNFKSLPIEVEFEIPQYTLSGLCVKYLKILEKPNYDSVSWIRYLTRNGNFIIRIQDNLL